MSEPKYPSSCVERFMQYVTIDTQSDEESKTFPSTEKQFVLLKRLVDELKELGIEDAAMDEHGYVFATIPATSSKQNVPVVGFIAQRSRFCTMGALRDLILFGEEGGEESGFLIMFRDQTSGEDTYAACRYLQIPFQSGGEVWLDFNRATNPSCAYATSFACPLPPAGNRLSVPIRAGEKTFSVTHH